MGSTLTRPKPKSSMSGLPPSTWEICGYFRHFFPGFAKLAKLLVCFKQRMPGSVEEEAFHTLQKKLATATILAYPDQFMPFILDAKASDVGIWAVVSQEIDGEKRLITYSSRTLTKADKRYCIT